MSAQSTITDWPLWLKNQPWQLVKKQEDFKTLPTEAQLTRIRHSAAHVMASALERVLPGTQYAIGPATAQGFFYDVKPPRPLTEADLEAIQKEIDAITAEAQPFAVAEVPKHEAIAYFEAMNQPHKVEILARIPDEVVTLYSHGKPDTGFFVDLCAGPHVPHSGACKHMKVLGLSGVHWRGEDTPTLTRVSGTAWASAENLNEYLEFLQEVKTRDHRNLGPQLGLFTFHPWAAAPLWQPKGVRLRNTLMDYWRQQIEPRGYVEILNPLFYKKDLFETSGHWAHFRENMFIFNDAETGEPDLALKPMNCPDTMLFFKSALRSYRELPMRVAEGQILHRNEATGAMHGLMRTRQFVQDDAHIFLTPEQVQAEILDLLRLIEDTYALFELPFALHLSTRPENYMGELSVWQQAEAGLKSALDALGKPYVIDEGEGAFYGPKIDINILDSLGRAWQCGTVQLDFQLPERFELEYVKEDGTTARPIVVHRAVYGSFERFLGILIEHLGGAFPTWLAPVQAVVLPIAERHHAYATEVLSQLKAAGIRAEIWGDDSVNYRIRQAETHKIPTMLVLGDREAEAQTASVRTYQHGQEGAKPANEVVDSLLEKTRNRVFDVTVKSYSALFRGDSGISSEAEPY